MTNDHIKTLEVLVEALEWQPIKTAPRDKKFYGYNGRVVPNVMWSEKRNDFDVNGWSHHKREYTHWYPQEDHPPPPETTTKQKEK